LNFEKVLDPAAHFPNSAAMSTAMLTGMNGTVAPALARLLNERGHTVIAWNRREVPVEKPEHHESFILSHRPDWFFKIATGSPDWMAGTAAICHRHGITYLYTSSVSVFDGNLPGPYPADRPPDAADDYGRYKAECERKIRAVNPGALIARLGWQIGDAPGNNNMVDFLDRTHRDQGRIEASSGWIPSTAFLADTVEALYALMTGHPGGLYQLEGNPGWSFHQIAAALNARHGNPWNIVKKEEPRRDLRMIDDRIAVGQLDRRLAMTP